MSLSNAQLAQKISDLIDRWRDRELEFQAWLAGTATGGPNSDGRYVLKDYLGTARLTKSPARLEADVSGLVDSALAHRNDAQAARDVAIGARDTALAHRNQADSHRLASLGAQASAELARSAAETAAANALGAASNASSSATTASNAATTATQAAADADADRIAADTARIAAEAAAAAAQAFNPANYAALAGATFTGLVRVTRNGDNFAARVADETGFSGLRVENAAGARRLEAFYIGTGRAAAYGAAPGQVVINAGSTDLVLSTLDAARLTLGSTGATFTGNVTAAGMTVTDGGSNFFRGLNNGVPAALIQWANASIAYRGVSIQSNSSAVATQQDTASPSWVLDMGGRAADGVTFSTDGRDALTLFRVAPGGSYLSASAAAIMRVYNNGRMALRRPAQLVNDSDYALELAAPSSSPAEISLRFHHEGQWWSQIRARADGFHFTHGADATYRDLFASGVRAFTVATNFSDTFSLGTPGTMPHYGLAWRDLSGGTSGPSALLSGFGGVRLYTVGVERLQIGTQGNTIHSGSMQFTGSFGTGGFAAAAGVEVGQSGGAGFVQGYHRGTSQFIPLRLTGSTITAEPNGDNGPPAFFAGRAVTTGNRFVGAVADSRDTAYTPGTLSRQFDFQFATRAGTLGIPGGGSYCGVLNLAPWGDDSGGGSYQLAFNSTDGPGDYFGGLFIRYGTRSAGWYGWREVVTSDPGRNYRLRPFPGSSGWNYGTYGLEGTPNGYCGLRLAGVAVNGGTPVFMATTNQVGVYLDNVRWVWREDTSHFYVARNIVDDSNGDRYLRIAGATSTGGRVTVQNGGSPSGGNDGDIWLVW